MPRLGDLGRRDVKVDQIPDIPLDFRSDVCELDAHPKYEGNPFGMPNVPDGLAPYPQRFVVEGDFDLQNALFRGLHVRIDHVQVFPLDGVGKEAHAMYGNVVKVCRECGASLLRPGRQIQVELYGTIDPMPFGSSSLLLGGCLPEAGLGHDSSDETG